MLASPVSRKIVMARLRAGIDDLEAQGAQHASGAVCASAEVVGIEWASGRVAVCDAENGPARTYGRKAVVSSCTGGQGRLHRDP
jgi:hypothetical protein